MNGKQWSDMKCMWGYRMDGQWTAFPLCARFSDLIESCPIDLFLFNKSFTSQPSSSIITTSVRRSNNGPTGPPPHSVCICDMCVSIKSRMFCLKPSIAVGQLPTRTVHDALYITRTLQTTRGGYAHITGARLGAWTPPVSFSWLEYIYMEVKKSRLKLLLCTLVFVVVVVAVVGHPSSVYTFPLCVS